MSGRLATVTGAVLLGGASSRMGEDKARLRVDGVPLAVRTARLLARCFEDVLLVGGDPPDGAPGRSVADVAGPPCALRGLVAALEAARTERVLVVATDLPGLVPELPLALVAAPEADCVAPRGERGPEPLCAVYRREVTLARARPRLAAGELALWGLLEGLSLSVLGGDDLALVDGGGLALRNVNAPADLEAFRAASESAKLE